MVALSSEEIQPENPVQEAAVTVTVAAQLAVPFALVTVRTKLVVAASAAVVQLPALELVKELHVPLVGLKAPSAGPLFIAQVKTEACPEVIEVGFAERVHVGAEVARGAATFKVKAFAVVVQVSLSVIVKLYVPAVVGAPDKSPGVPPKFKPRPAGKAPAVTDQV